MKKYEKKQIEKNILTDILCDICGKGCKCYLSHDAIGDDCFNFEYSSLTAGWGYGSYHDDEDWEYYFCMDCSEKIMDKINELRKENDRGS